jgi:lipase
MGSAAPQPLDIPVDGGRLRALRWGTGEAVVLAAHGITASAASWQAVAGRLPSGWSLIAVDLRGRGGSAEAPGPFGLDRHGADLIAIARHIGAERCVLTGHSMGAYAALLAAANSPGLFHRLVLIDGGLPLPVPPGLDLDEVLKATLGPALARLDQTFDSVEHYFDFWRAHPAFANTWNDDLEAYLRYDLADASGHQPGPSGRPDPSGLRSRVRAVAVRADGRDLLESEKKITEALRGLRLPTVLLTAPRGMMGEPPPFLPAELVEVFERQIPMLTIEVVPDTNHYTIVFAPEAAETVARHLTAS